MSNEICKFCSVDCPFCDPDDKQTVIVCEGVHYCFEYCDHYCVKCKKISQNPNGCDICHKTCEMCDKHCDKFSYSKICYDCDADSSPKPREARCRCCHRRAREEYGGSMYCSWCI